MLSATRYPERTSLQFGQGRDLPDPVRFERASKQASQNAGLETSTPYRPYPSPPMSGSSLPSDRAPDSSARAQSSGAYQLADSQDAYRQGFPPHTTSSNPRAHQANPLPTPRLYGKESPTTMEYPYRKQDEGPPPAMTHQYQPQAPQDVTEGLTQQSYGSLPGPGYAPSGTSSNPEDQPYTSPKSQRKTKGHVASACVPCKKAHLRCDALRPCSRCVSNGKQDACVDVQHKKRGRPRLRDEKDGRYDPARFPHPQDATARRPLSIHPAGNPGYDNPSPRSPPYQVLKFQQSDSGASRYAERGPGSDQGMFHPSGPMSSRPLEPVAYLTIDLVIANASTSFMDAIGGFNPKGRSLNEILVPSEANKAFSIQEQFRDEQKRREPNYLPPIMSRVDHYLQGLGFSIDEVSRYRFDRHEYLTFAAGDGHARPYHARMSLTKEGSHYFVVMLLNLGTQHHAYGTPPSHAREPSGPYQGQQHPSSQPGYPRNVAGVGPFEGSHYRHGEHPFPSRPGPGQLGPGPGQATSPGLGSFGASPSRSVYGAQPSQQLEPPGSGRHTSDASFQLPPIRSYPDHAREQGDPSWHREERHSRVDIGGLIDRPDEQNRPR